MSENDAVLLTTWHRRSASASRRIDSAHAAAASNVSHDRHALLRMIGSSPRVECLAWKAISVGAGEAGTIARRCWRVASTSCIHSRRCASSSPITYTVRSSARTATTTLDASGFGVTSSTARTVSSMTTQCGILTCWQKKSMRSASSTTSTSLQQCRQRAFVKTSRRTNDSPARARPLSPALGSPPMSVTLVTASLRRLRNVMTWEHLGWRTSASSRTRPCRYASSRQRRSSTEVEYDESLCPFLPLRRVRLILGRLSGSCFCRRAKSDDIFSTDHDSPDLSCTWTMYTSCSLPMHTRSTHAGTVTVAQSSIRNKSPTSSSRTARPLSSLIIGRRCSSAPADSLRAPSGATLALALASVRSTWTAGAGLSLKRLKSSSSLSSSSYSSSSSSSSFSSRSSSCSSASPARARASCAVLLSCAAPSVACCCSRCCGTGIAAVSNTSSRHACGNSRKCSITHATDSSVDSSDHVPGAPALLPSAAMTTCGRATSSARPTANRTSASALERDHAPAGLAHASAGPSRGWRRSAACLDVLRLSRLVCGRSGGSDCRGCGWSGADGAGVAAAAASAARRSYQPSRTTSSMKAPSMLRPDDVLRS
eukprot:Unigene6290_Nuclearia_a/m.19378 Unigene6290_Nuclearia_a/g.19378  ORF Unigene6290_Nuclearia_a/g.19378 Unigene6290_Nuclearia_a/m.19378 type:complete len:597 (-) Unigene6290_Nuclearia_a:483-2273(-)